MHGKTSSVDSLQKQLNRNVILIEKFETFMYRNISRMSTADQETHYQFRENFEKTYFDLTDESVQYARASFVSTEDLRTHQHPYPRQRFYSYYCQSLCRIFTANSANCGLS